MVLSVLACLQAASTLASDRAESSSVTLSSRTQSHSSDGVVTSVTFCGVTVSHLHNNRQRLSVSKNWNNSRGAMSTIVVCTAAVSIQISQLSLFDRVILCAFN